jgi:hypothetical protein
MHKPFILGLIVPLLEAKHGLAKHRWNLDRVPNSGGMRFVQNCGQISLSGKRRPNGNKLRDSRCLLIPTQVMHPWPLKATQ